MVGPGGIHVEQVLVQKDLRRPPIPMLRVRKGTYFVSDWRSVAELAKLVDLASPEPQHSVDH